MLLIKQSLGATIVSVTACLAGRCIICDFKYLSRDWRVVVVSAPTRAEERKVFFENIRATLDTDRIANLLGDFNRVCYARDNSRDTSYCHTSVLLLQEAATDYCLEDVGDTLLEAKNVEFAHFEGTSHAHLDRAYVSFDLLPECCDYAVTPVAFSGNCLVSFSLGGRKEKANQFNGRLWKMNSKLLQDEEFKTQVTEKIRREPGEQTDCASRWELFKQEVKMTALER